jgi:hypothetical protein
VLLRASDLLEATACSGGQLNRRTARGGELPAAASNTGCGGGAKDGAMEVARARVGRGAHPLQAGGSGDGVARTRGGSGNILVVLNIN